MSSRMENSSNSSCSTMNSSGSQGFPSPSDASEWSTFVAAFMQAAGQEEDDDALSDGGSSVVADAASCAGTRKACKKLKKKAMKNTFHDDPFTDTATSPYYGYQKTTVETDNKKISQKEKGDATCTWNFQNCNGFANSRELKNSDVPEVEVSCSELRQRGLCLVPMSMLIDYFKYK